MIKRHYKTILAIVFAVLLGFIGGFGISRWQQNRTQQFPIFNEAYHYLLNYSYSLPETDEEKKELEYGMINGLFAANGDPHTRFIPPAIHEIEMNNLEGKFGGIGAGIEKDTDGNFVLYPVKGSPAELAGIQNGDRIVQVNDLIVDTESNMDDVLAEIRGPVKSEVTLILFRESAQSNLTVTVVREEFSIPSVTYSFPQPGVPIAVIKVNLVASTTPDEVNQAMQAVLQEPVDAIVLDLRDNAGGFVDAGVDIAGLYLPSGELLGKRFRDKKDELVTSQKDGAYLEIPLYVFVNHNTASAAEIITGALQAQQRVKVIGTTTYGKDSVQLVFDLDDGSSVHITNAKWYIPGLGYEIGEKGIIPDILFADDQMTIDACILAIQQDMQ
jgi:carboxyl-terminal processing protease